MKGARTYRSLLLELKTFSEDFATREAERRKEFRTGAGTMRRDHMDDLEKLDEEAHRKLLELEQKHAAEKEATEARLNTLHARVEELITSTRRHLAEEREKDDARIQHEIQTSMLKLTREMDKRTAETNALRVELEDKLDTNDETLDSLEAMAISAASGYRSFVKHIEHAEAEYDFAGDHLSLPKDHDDLTERVTLNLRNFEKIWTPHIFREVPLFVLLLLMGFLHGIAPIVAKAMKFGEITMQQAGTSFGIVAFVLIGLYVYGRLRGRPLIDSIANDLRVAPILKVTARSAIETWHEDSLEEIEREREEGNTQLKAQWAAAKEEAATSQKERETELTKREARVRKRCESHRAAWTRLMEERHCSEMDRQVKENVKSRADAESTFQKTRSGLDVSLDEDMTNLKKEWNDKIAPYAASFEQTGTEIERLFPHPDREFLNAWSPTEEFTELVPFAQAVINMPVLTGADDEESILEFPAGKQFTLPLVLVNPEEGSLVIESNDAGKNEIAELLNRTMLNILLSSPPGRVSFTIIDPVGLGENFAGIMHLADYEESLITSRIWTQTNQIEQRLADLNEHMEKVIQMYLRDEYATIKEYNQKAGTIAEKYHYVVVAGFPNSFSDLTVKRLQSIVVSGARCGVYTLIHWDHRHRLTSESLASELRERSVRLHYSQGRFSLDPDLETGIEIKPLPSIDTDVTNQLIHKIGKASVDSSRVAVPFSHVAPPEEEVWSLDTTSELRVPIGRTGATKLQQLCMGKGTQQHALIAGKTGSGKSTLFHIIITNLALWADPDHVEFYLIDFKKGVEFKSYAKHHLPHARVIAIESDRDFGLSVLQRLDEELKRRGDLFRDMGVQDLPGYVKAGGKEPIPRTILLIDEFQEFFVEDDRTAQNAALLLDRIVRQGRAFGIHAILGSQTLGGAFTLARSTLGQMAIRVALQCNEADAMLIMDDNNPAARMLSRPGEGIYNDEAGRLEGNSPFQVVWLSEEEREKHLQQINERTRNSDRNWPGPIVFEGNLPADVAENSELRDLLEKPTDKTPSDVVAYLGAPNSIKSPTAARFGRQSGSHLLMVGQNEDAMMAILTSSILTLAAQYPSDKARFLILDSTTTDSIHRDFLSQLGTRIPHPTETGQPGDTARLIHAAAEILAERTDSDDSHPEEVFVIIHGLPRFKKLKQDDDFSFSLEDDDSGASTGSEFKKLIDEGSSNGIHLIITCDTANNVNRIINRKSLSEIEMKVLFQMSATDSAALIDSAKASSLGQNRALYYNESRGELETFRPYKMPEEEWIREAVEKIGVQG